MQRALQKKKVLLYATTARVRTRRRGRCPAVLTQLALPTSGEPADTALTSPRASAGYDSVKETCEIFTLGGES